MLLSLFFASSALAANTKWDVTEEGEISALAVGNNGVIYTIIEDEEDDEEVSALFAWEDKGDQGEYKWEKDLVGDAEAVMVGQDGTIYVTFNGNHATQGVLQAFNPSGKVKWTSNTLGKEGALAEGADGKIYVFTKNARKNGMLEVFNNADGNKTNSVETEVCGYGRIFIGVDDSIYLVGDYQSNQSGQAVIEKYNSTLGLQAKSEVIMEGDTSGYLHSFAMDYAGRIYLTGANKISTGSNTYKAEGLLRVYNSSLGLEWTLNLPSTGTALLIGPDETIYIAGSKTGDNSTDAEVIHGVVEAYKRTDSSENATKLWSLEEEIGQVKDGLLGNNGALYLIGRKIDAEEFALWIVSKDGTLSQTIGGIGIAQPEINAVFTLGSDGTLYGIGQDDTDEDVGKLYAVPTTSGGLAESIWPSFFATPQCTSRLTVAGGDSNQIQGVTPPVPVSGIVPQAAKKLTKEKLEETYNAGAELDFIPNAFVQPLAPQTVDANKTYIFKSTVSGAALLGSKTGSVKSAGLRVLKLFSNNTIREYNGYEDNATAVNQTPRPAGYFKEGTWWLSQNNNHVAWDTPISPEATYGFHYVIKDNGDFDDNATAGIIQDPLVVGASPDDGSGGGGGGGGCSLATGATLGLEWLLLAGAGLPLLRRRFRK